MPGKSPTNKQKTIIFSDFDGTITQTDTLVYLLDNYGAKDWWDIEVSLMKGELAEMEALRREIDSLNVSWEEAMSALKREVKIAPGFYEFVQWTEENSIPFIVLSGGFEEISREYLSENGFRSLEIRANRIEVTGNKWKVIPSHRRKIKGLCNHCKSSSVVDAKQAGHFTIYIGDGTTDRCPASNADLVFAKGDLAEYCIKEGINHISFKDFRDLLVKMREG